MQLPSARAIAAFAVGDEALGEFGMAQRLAGIVGNQILLRHVGDVLGLGVLGVVLRYITTSAIGKSK